MEQSSTGRLLSVKEAAAYLGLGRQTIYNLVSQGRLTHVKMFRRVLFRPSDLEKLVQEKLKEGRA